MACSGSTCEIVCGPGIDECSSDEECACGQEEDCAMCYKCEGNACVPDQEAACGDCGKCNASGACEPDPDVEVGVCESCQCSECKKKPEPDGAAIEGKPCKVCDGKGGERDRPDRTPCEKEGIKNGCCVGGKCVECTCKGFAKTEGSGELVITGPPEKSSDKILAKAKEIGKQAHMDEFLECKWPLDWECPKKDCKVEKDGPHQNSTMEPQGTEEEPCDNCKGKEKTGTYSAASGNCYSDEAGEKQLFNNAVKKLEALKKKFKCPDCCAKKAWILKVYDIKKKKYLVYNSAKAKVDYKISCVKKTKEYDENKTMIRIKMWASKKCVDK